MHPILVNINGVNVFMYAIFVALAYLLGVVIATKRARRFGLDPKLVLNVGISVVVGAVVGAKLLLLLTHWDELVRDPASVYGYLQGGGVFFGGAVLGAGAGYWYTRHAKMSPGKVADLAVPGVVFAHAVGRLGCFFAGCCFGRPTSVPWAITFTNLWAAEYSGTPLDIPLHPTQLYDAGSDVLILAILLATERRGRPFPGRMFWLYVLLYSLSRFGIEFFRGDPRGHVGVFSTSQFMALLLAPLAVGMLGYLGRGARGPAPTQVGEAA